MFFSSSSKAAAPPTPDSVVAFKQQIEMMNSVFMLSIEQCKKKCIEAVNYHKDQELTKGEAVCLKRCGEKLFAVLELASQELAKGQLAGPQ